MIPYPPLETVIDIGLVLACATIVGAVPLRRRRPDLQMGVVTGLYVALALSGHALYATPVAHLTPAEEPEAGGRFAITVGAYLPHLAMVALVATLALLVLVPRLFRRSLPSEVFLGTAGTTALLGAFTTMWAGDSGLDLVRPEAWTWLLRSALAYAVTGLGILVAYALSLLGESMLTPLPPESPDLTARR